VEPAGLSEIAENREALQGVLETLTPRPNPEEKREVAIECGIRVGDLAVGYKNR